MASCPDCTRQLATAADRARAEIETRSDLVIADVLRRLDVLDAGGIISAVGRRILREASAQLSTLINAPAKGGE